MCRYIAFWVLAQDRRTPRWPPGSGATCAAEAGIPLRVLAPEVPDLHALYGCDYALIRPDHYIAWCGNSLDDAMGVLPLVTGKLPESVT